MKSIRIRVAAVVVTLLAVACKESDAPKTPLGAPPPGSASIGGGSVPAISGEARVALDSANALFRAKRYDAALMQYNRAAALAPTELAPLLGVMMVADITKNTRLAEATRPRIRALDPALADSLPAMSHSKIIEGHPPVNPVPPAT